MRKLWLAVAACMLVGGLAALAQTNSPQAPSTNINALPGQSWLMSGTQAYVRTYKYAATVVLATSATDVIQIQGSATKTVRIPRIVISAFDDSAVNTLVPTVIRRSTALSGGTCAAGTVGKADPLDDAATAVVTACTANPTTGTGVANLGICRIGAGLTTSVVNGGCIMDFGIISKPIYLRGTSDFLVINFGGASAAGNSADFDITFTEDNG